MPSGGINCAGRLDLPGNKGVSVHAGPGRSGRPAGLRGPSTTTQDVRTALTAVIVAVALARGVSQGAVTTPPLPFAGLTSAADPTGTSSCREMRQLRPGEMDPVSAARDLAPQTSQPSSVRWARPDRVRDDGELDRWCRGVGPAVVHRPSDPSSYQVPSPPRQRGARNTADPARATPDGLTVVAWNTHVGGGDLDRLIRNLRSGGLTGSPSRHFVLLLQEVYRAGDVVPETADGEVRHAGRIGPDHEDRRSGGVDEVARRHGLHLFYAPSMRNGAVGELGSGPSEDRGNAILSTLPLSELEAVELPVRKQRRVIVAATLSWLGPDGSERRLRVASVHLDHVSSWRRLHRSLGADRAEDVRLLLDTFRGEDRIVVGGDFNSWFGGRREEGIRLMRTHFPRPHDPPDGATLGYRLPLVNSLVDHLFFRVPQEWAATYAVVPDRYGSDHRPLVGWVGPGAPPWESVGLGVGE